MSMRTQGLCMRISGRSRTGVAACVLAAVLATSAVPVQLAVQRGLVAAVTVTGPGCRLPGAGLREVSPTLGQESSAVCTCLALPCDRGLGCAAQRCSPFHDQRGTLRPSGTWPADSG